MNHIWIIEAKNRAGEWIPTGQVYYTREIARENMEYKDCDYVYTKYRVVKYISARRANHYKNPAW